LQIKHRKRKIKKITQRFTKFKRKYSE